MEHSPRDRTGYWDLEGPCVSTYTTNAYIFTYLTSSLIQNFGAESETRTHGGFPTAYKTVAIATMRLRLNFCDAKEFYLLI